MKKILLIGADKRTIKLAEYLKCDTDFNGKYYIERIILPINNDQIKDSEIIIFSIPFCNADGDVEIAENFKINYKELINFCGDKIIIAGGIKEDIVKVLEMKNNIVIDIMKRVNLSKKNAIPTAEGVIKIAIENTEITLDSSKVLVLGFGKTGKIISNRMHSLGAELFCFDNNLEEVANIKKCGYNVVENLINNECCDEKSYKSTKKFEKVSENFTKKDLCNINIIVNTIPQLVLNSAVLQYVNNKTLIIDIASGNGGVDQNCAAKRGIKVIHALGLPAKIAPSTAAKYLYEEIKTVEKDIFNKRNDFYEEITEFEK